MATPTQTATQPAPDQTVEQKIQQVREMFADAPEVGRKALDNVLAELTSQVSEPKTRMESAGRVGSRQGMVSELTIIAPFAPGGAARLRAFLRLLNGNFDGADKVGSLHDMRFVFLDNDTSCSSPPPSTANGIPTSTISRRRSRTTWTSSAAGWKGGRGFAARRRRTISPAIRSLQKPGTSPTRI
jgi:hypothetical protein